MVNLKEIAKEIRRETLRMIYNAKSGHPGGSLSEVEILTVLYFRILRINPNNPEWPDRDRFILSKGHACPPLYYILAKKGFFDIKELARFRTINSLLQGHTSIKIPGVEMSAGSLGQGLSFGVGVALAGKLDKKDYDVYVLLGDGELQEGIVWEAAMTAAHYNLDNLIAIVDHNKIQNDDFISRTKKLSPLSEKWSSFGWKVLNVDGHNFTQLEAAFNEAKKSKQPTVIIANTIKGRGVSFMENNPSFHGKPPDNEEFKKAMEELK